MAALAIARDDPDLQFRMGWMRLQQERLEEAEAHLLRSIRLGESDHKGHALLAIVYRKMGREADARTARRRALALDPERSRR